MEKEESIETRDFSSSVGMMGFVYSTGDQVEHKERQGITAFNFGGEN